MTVPAAAALPVALVPLAGGDDVVPVWRNEAGGLTFRLGTGATTRYVKWAPAGSGVDLAAERERLAWFAGRARVPELLDHGADATGAWLVTAGLPGESAVSPRWRDAPDVVARAAGAGLRELHDRLPVDACPFAWSAPARVARARAHPTDPAGRHAEHRGLTVAAALARLADVPPVDRLVVCHGDACLPNTLLAPAPGGARGRTPAVGFAGHVDVGALGVADRWADLAVGSWSLTWNLGPGLEEAYLDAYGVAPDPARTAWYRLLWDLT